MTKNNVIPNEYKHLISQAIKLQNSANFIEALPIYLKLAEQLPNNSEILFQLGSLYGQMGEFEQCILLLKQSLSISPAQVNAHNNIAIAYEMTQQLAAAIASYEKSLTLSENAAHTHCNLGDLYRKRHQFKDALWHLDKCLALSPTHENALLNKAILLGEMNKVDDAKQCYLEALNLYPNNEKLLNNFSAFLQLEGDLDDAEKLGRRSLQLNPQSPQTLSNLGNLLTKQRQFKESETYLIKAIKIAPLFIEPHINLGYLYHNLARFDGAITCYNNAIKIDPENSLGHWYRSFTLLLTGKLDSAWDDYEYGLKNGERNMTKFQLPFYAPENSRAKEEHENSLLITAEQAIGDQVMFASCLPDLLKQNINIILECDKRLVALFKRTFPAVNVIYTGQYSNESLKKKYPHVLQQLSIGSLPRIYRRSTSAFPNSINKMMVDKEKKEKWKKRYEALGTKPKIGISWQGGVKLDHKKRSMLLEAWIAILKLDCHFINLQYGNHCEEIAHISNKYDIKIHDWPDSDSLKDIDDFSAQISALDLVISVGNTNVHLAGSLNIPTWCLLPFVPSWRWLFNGDNCLWYPSVKILRQEKMDDWEGVLKTVKCNLEKRLMK